MINYIYWASVSLFYDIPLDWQSGVETCRTLKLVMKCVLFG